MNNYNTYYTIEAVTEYGSETLYRDDTSWQDVHNQYDIYDLHEAERYFDEAIQDSENIATIELVKHTVPDDGDYDYKTIKTWRSSEG